MIIKYKKGLRVGKICSILLALIMAMVSLSGCKEATNTLDRYTESYTDFFDTSTTITAFAQEQKHFEEMAEKFHKSMMEFHKLYDIYNDYEGINNIKSINDKAGKDAVKVDQKIIDLIKLGKEMYEETDGLVNIAMGSVLSIWHEVREYGMENPEKAYLPDMARLQEASKHMDISKVIIDEENSTVYLEDPEMSLDVGAIAKGYATEKTAEMLEERGYDHVSLSVGGNIRTIGKKFNEDREEVPWVIGVQNPDVNASEKIVDKIKLVDKSLVTSGVYERYYTVKGKDYHHIINPKTLMPERNFLSVSILCKDGGMADGYSTAIFNMNLEAGKKLVESKDGVEALWILPDGTIVKSDGWPS